ncbi:MAG: Putative xylanase, partial [uncultured Gemmatimonadaceae bacterium]
EALASRARPRARLRARAAGGARSGAARAADPGEACVAVDDGQHHPRRARGARRPVAAAGGVAGRRARRGAALLRRRQRDDRTALRRAHPRHAVAGAVRGAAGARARRAPPRPPPDPGHVLHPLGQPRAHPGDGRQHQAERPARVRRARVGPRAQHHAPRLRRARAPDEGGGRVDAHDGPEAHRLPRAELELQRQHTLDPAGPGLSLRELAHGRRQPVRAAAGRRPDRAGGASRGVDPRRRPALRPARGAVQRAARRGARVDGRVRQGVRGGDDVRADPAPPRLRPPLAHRGARATHRAHPGEGRGPRLVRDPRRSGGVRAAGGEARGAAGAV